MVKKCRGGATAVAIETGIDTYDEWWQDLVMDSAGANFLDPRLKRIGCRELQRLGKNFTSLVR